MDICDVIRSRRRELKITQECLAFGVGVSAGCVAMWESSAGYRRQPALFNRRKLAELLQLPLSALIEGVGPEAFASGGILHGPKSPDEAALLRHFRQMDARQRKTHLRLFEDSAKLARLATGIADPVKEDSARGNRVGAVAK